MLTMNNAAAPFGIQQLAVFKNPDGSTYAFVGHDPAAGIISDHWFRSFEQESGFHEAIEFICDAFETGDYSLWLADLRYLNRSFREFGPCLAQDIMPRGLAAGLKREAILRPQYRGAPGAYDVFGAASDTREKLPRADFLKFFEDIDPAMAWLAGESQPRHGRGAATYQGKSLGSRIVMLFYDKILDSDQVGNYFEDIDMKKLIDHQTKFVASITGGPASFSDDML